MARNPGRYLLLKDGRKATLYNRDAQPINGKFPVYVSEIIQQGDIFSPDQLPHLKDFQVHRIMISSDQVEKVIGYFD